MFFTTIIMSKNVPTLRNKVYGSDGILFKDFGRMSE